MGDRTAEFFDELGRRGHESLLTKVVGTLRFDLEHDERTDHWFLAICRGDISVARERREADCVVRTDHALFDCVVAGETKALPAMVRNEIMVEGRLYLFIVLNRLLPGPPGARHPRLAAREGRRQP